MPLWLKVPHMTVAGDQMPPTDADGNPLDWDDPYEAYVGHPRTAGAHAATLRLAREHNVPLMHMIAQNSYWAAKHLGDTGLEAMQIRGRMQEGMVADITIFNPETVTDNATYKIGSNGLPSTGIPFVLVNGVVIVRDSRVAEGVFPGQPIRFPVEEKGRWVPLEKKSYLDELLKPDIPFDDGLGGQARQPLSRLEPPENNKITRSSIQKFDPLAISALSREPGTDSNWFVNLGGPEMPTLVYCQVHGRYENVEREL